MESLPAPDAAFHLVVAHGIWNLARSGAEFRRGVAEAVGVEVFDVAEQIWRELAEAGIETVIDDRDERAGVKFNDADLVGWPFQVVVGKKGLAEGVVEFKSRANGERSTVPVAEAVAHIAALVAEQRTRFAH